MAVPLCFACDCERPVQLAGLETAFWVICESTFCFWLLAHFGGSSGSSAVLSLNLCVRILTNLHGEPRTTVACLVAVLCRSSLPREPGLSAASP